MNKYIWIGSMILSGTFFGWVWYFSKLLIQDIPPLTFTTLRLWIGFLILCILGRKLIPELQKISKKDWKNIIITALFGMARWAICFTLAVKRTTVTNAAFMFFVPAVILPLWWALFTTLKIRYTSYIAVLLCLVWLYFLFDPQIIGTSLIGNVFWLLAWCSNVIYILMAKKISHLPGKLTSIATFLVLSLFLMCLTLVVEWYHLSTIDLASWNILWYIWWCIWGAYYFLNIWIKNLSTYLVWVMVIREPIASFLLWVLFLWEVISLPVMIWLWAILLWFGLISMDKGLME